MAHGRRDYTWGVLQDSILPGRYTVTFNGFDSINTNPGFTDTAYEYTVPAGKKLYVSGVIVSSNTARMAIAVIKRNLEVLATAWFSFNWSFDFGAYGSFPFEEGDEIKVHISSGEEFSYTVHTNVIGFIEDLV